MNLLPPNSIQNENEVFIDKGKTENEVSFVLFRNGVYAGFGYIESDNFQLELALLQLHLIPQKEDTEIKRILKFYRQIWPDKKRFVLS
jgi:DNA polymerase III subunit epsilon